MDPEKVSGRPPVDVEVGQVGLGVLGGADEVHVCPSSVITLIFLIISLWVSSALCTRETPTKICILQRNILRK